LCQGRRRYGGNRKDRKQPEPNQSRHGHLALQPATTDPGGSGTSNIRPVPGNAPSNLARDLREQAVSALSLSPFANQPVEWRDWKVKLRKSIAFCRLLPPLSPRLDTRDIA
jgi:hypothetical protein